jgi:hypothetical protein
MTPDRTQQQMKRNTQVENRDNVLVKAATTIGKAAGKLVGMVNRSKTDQSQPTTRKPTQKNTSPTTKKKLAAKKTGTSVKTNKAVRSGSRKRKSS